MTVPATSSNSKLAEELVTITEYPKEIRAQNPGDTLTVGDLHGNVIKLLWILIREGAIEMSKKDFETLCHLYYERMHVSGLIELNLKLFNEVLARITIKNRNFSLRLIGDVFADRGRNDYLTLKVLEKLHVGGIKPEILYSNHDAVLLNNYEKQPSAWKTFLRDPALNLNMQSSADNLLNLPAKNFNEIPQLVHRYVIPYMKLLSYSLSEDGKKITVFMHAPNDFGVIRTLYNALNPVPYKKPESALELAAIIDKINAKWAPLKNQKLYDCYSYSTGDPKCKLIYDFVWNRPRGNTGTPINIESYPDYVEFVVHGHNGPMEIPVDLEKHGPKQADIDAHLGSIDKQGQDILHGNYSFFVTAQSPQLTEALKWIASIEALRDEILLPESDRYKKLANVVSTAHSLLLASIKADTTKANISFISFKKAIDDAQKLNLAKTLAWESVISGFLNFIPAPPQYIAALKWITTIEAQRDKELLEMSPSKTERYTQLANVVKVAHSLLLASIGTLKTDAIKRKEAFSSFKKAIDLARAKLKTARKPLALEWEWEDVYKNFLAYLPNFALTPEGKNFLRHHSFIDTKNFEKTGVKLTTKSPTRRMKEF